MIFQSFCSPCVAEGSAVQVGRPLSDGQVQSFDVGGVQLPRILGITPEFVPSPRCTGSGFPLNTYDAICSPFLDDLAEQAGRPKDSLNNLSIEFESIGGDQWNPSRFYSGENILEEGERVAIGPLTNDRRRPETRPYLDGSEDPNRWMPIAADHRADLLNLQFTNADLGNHSMVESTTRHSSFLQPAIHGIPSNLMDSANRRFVPPSTLLAATSSNGVRRCGRR